MGTNKMELLRKHLPTIVGKTLHINDLKLFIRMNFGADERTVKSYMSLIIDTGIAYEIEHLKYHIRGLSEKHLSLLSNEITPDVSEEEILTE